jgi:hypothetical protein
MSIFGSIMGAIFGHPAAAQSGAPGTAASPSIAPAPGTTSQSNVDVEAVMNDLAAHSKEKLNWKTSIVDLMKLLKLDSSLPARKELAKELGYTGSTDDSATMNIWLHKQVMQKLAANGGKVPAELAH